MKVNIFLCAGLGNQLFQLAWAYYLNKKYNLNVVLPLVFLKKNPHHGSDFSLLLGKNISNISFLEKSIFGFNIFAKMIRKIMILTKIISIPNLLLFDINNIIRNISDFEKRINYPYQFAFFMCVDVALFSKSFFRDQIKNKHNHCIEFYQNKYSEYVGIHCRRGDTLNNVFHKEVRPTKISYIKSAMSKFELRPTEISYIKSAMSKFKNRKFIIFSDDIGWCKKNLKNYKDLEYSCKKSPIEDFLGLMSCKDYILSGSSFSWWAALINASKETKVIIPKSVLHYPYMSVLDNEKIGWDYEII